jgi:hypothetical protein
VTIPQLCIFFAVATAASAGLDAVGVPFLWRLAIVSLASWCFGLWWAERRGT